MHLYGESLFSSYDLQWRMLFLNSCAGTWRHQYGGRLDCWLHGNHLCILQQRDLVIQFTKLLAGCDSPLLCGYDLQWRMLFLDSITRP